MTTRALQREAAYGDVSFHASAISIEHGDNWRTVLDAIWHPGRRNAVATILGAGPQADCWPDCLTLVGPTWLEAEHDADWYSDLSYADYLKSDAWREFRERALVDAGHRCRVCNSGRSLHVHHRTYDRIGWERNDDVTVLCVDCHQAHHERHPR